MAEQSKTDIFERLPGPLLLVFNAVFGVGSSCMMSRPLGVKDYDTVRRSSAFSF